MLRVYYTTITFDYKIDVNNENIKTIYKQLMMKYHPDKNPNAIEEATRISQELNRIYSEYKKNTRK